MYRQWIRGALAGVTLALSVTIGLGGLLSAPALAQNNSLAEQIRSNDLAVAFPAIASRAAELRGLVPRAEVQRTMLTPEQLRARMVDELDRPESLESIEHSRKLMVALGLLAPDVDLYALELQFRTGVVLGQYDPDTKQLYVISSAAAPGLMERVTLAHEYTHALQDQYYDIRALMPRNSDNSDRDLAVSALLEGDALIMEELFQSQVFTAQERATRRREEQALSSGLDLDRIPLVLREETYFPYVEGPQFIVSAVGQDAMRSVLQTGAGYGPLVNRLFEHPPRSTAQILHPEKYLNGVNPVEVRFPDLAGALGEGWRQLHKDVLGEIDHRILVQQFLNRDLGERAAAGWAGDAFALLGKDDQVAVVVGSRWDSDADAVAWFNAYGNVVRARYGDRLQILEQQADRLVWRTPDGLQLLHRVGVRTDLVIAPTVDDVNHLEQALAEAPAAAPSRLIPALAVP
jgi:hypothetical protein